MQAEVPSHRLRLVQAETEREMKVTYEVRQEIGDRMVLLGTLAFDEENKDTLTLAGTGAPYEALRATWAKVGALPVLEYPVHRRRREPDGAWISLQDLARVKRSDPDYPLAVVEYLGLQFGYMLNEKL